MNVANSVLERYSKGAQQREEALCCPVEYDARLLQMLPREIIEKDYGCGDPSRYVQPGDVILDLGSGSGKICYMAAQLTGPEGRVIGVDMNDDMLALARQYQQEMAQKLGNDRVRFHKGYIQDLALDLEATEKYLRDHPVQSLAALHELQAAQNLQKRRSPMIPDNHVDLVISNCVLNLVDDSAKQHLVTEIFRVLKPGGRVAISDIVSDEFVPEAMKQDSQLWSGCISGAFQEREFLDVFSKQGFQAVRYDKWDAQPWRVEQDIEFRSVTLTAIKPMGTECWDRGHAVIYKGPYEQVRDEEGHIYYRGRRMAVCERTFHMLTTALPYGDDFIGIEPAQARDAQPWCASPGTVRDAKESKGGAHHGGKQSGGCC